MMVVLSESYANFHMLIYKINREVVNILPISMYVDINACYATA